MPGKSLKECHSSQPGRQCKIDFCVFFCKSQVCLVCLIRLFFNVWWRGVSGDKTWHICVIFLALHGFTWQDSLRGDERERGDDMQQGTTVQIGNMAVARTQPLNVGHISPPTELLWNMRIISRWVSGDRSRSTKTQSLPAPDQTIKRGIITTWNCKSNLKKHKVTKWRNVKVSTYPWSAEIYAVNIYSGS